MDSYLSGWRINGIYLENRAEGDGGGGIQNNQGETIYWQSDFSVSHESRKDFKRGNSLVVEQCRRLSCHAMTHPPPEVGPLVSWSSGASSKASIVKGSWAVGAGWSGVEY
jgi:hypothetical protein